MERIHLVGRNDVEKLCVSKSYMALPVYFDDNRYRASLLRLSGHGIVHLLSYYSQTVDEIIEAAKSVGATCVWVDGRPFTAKRSSFLSKLQEHFEVTVVLQNQGMRRLKEEYLCLSQSTSANIAIPCIPTDEGHGFGRFHFICDLVSSRQWCIRRKHYFWELEDPAELAVYNKSFTSAIRNTFVGFASRRCYVDSRYGVLYSGEYGLLCAPITDIGNVVFHRGYDNPQQYSVFRLNDETIQSYIHGALGDQRAAQLRGLVGLE